MSQTTLLFEVDDATIRTPKRGESGYAAQVWVQGGYWELGTHAERFIARAVARAFAAELPEPGDTREPAVWHKKRNKSQAPREEWKWIRRVKGGAWQARPWLGAGHGSLNLGLFTIEQHGEFAEWAAAQVAKAFDREWQGGRTVGEVVEYLKHAKKPTERVPMHVEVPIHQRELLRSDPPDREREKAERVAVTLRDNLFGEPVTADGLLDHWRATRDRREEYLADFMQGLEEGETVEDLVELLAD